MRYKEFQVTHGNRVKRLGLLGEIHHYNKNESRFARDIVQSFNNIAIEGGRPGGYEVKKEDYLEEAFFFFSRPTFKAFNKATERTYPDAQNFALDFEKNLIGLESQIEEGKLVLDKRISMPVKLGATAFALMALPFSPIIYALAKVEFKLLGDAEVLGTKAYALHSYTNKWIKNILGDPFGGKRDISMSTRIISALDKYDDLLAVVGKGHLPKIEELIRENVNVEQTADVIEVINEDLLNEYRKQRRNKVLTA